MKVLLLSIVAALACAHAAHAASYPNSSESAVLEAKLPTAVKVFCTQNTNYNFAVLADHELYLDLNVCAALQHQPSEISFPRAAEVLYHEWWHVAFQETNEQNTEAGAWSILRYTLRHYWGFTPAQAQAAYDQAVQWSPYSPVPYQTNHVDPLLALGS